MQPAAAITLSRHIHQQRIILPAALAALSISRWAASGPRWCRTVKVQQRLQQERPMLAVSIRGASPGGCSAATSSWQGLVGMKAPDTCGVQETGTARSSGASPSA